MNLELKTAAASAARVAAIAVAALAFATGAQAQRHGGGYGGAHYSHGGGYGGGHYGRGGAGWIWGGVGLGLGLGLASYYNSYPYYYSNPGYVVVDPPVVYDNPQPVYAQPVYSQPVPARSSQPVIYPRNGQSAAKTDADANACSEWAGKQPNAASDSSVFQRGIMACMDARGYTVR